MLIVQLSSGRKFETPFSMLKEDRPLDLAKYIIREVVESKRGGKYEVWSKNVLKRTIRTIRGLQKHNQCWKPRSERVIC